MTRFPRVPGALLIVVALGISTSAHADVIRITSGTAISRDDLFGVDVMVASPDHGFSLSASGDFAGGRYDLYAQCFLGPECMPGRVLSLAAGWSGTDFVGTATADGLTFPLCCGDENTGAAGALFDGTWTVPAFTGNTATSVAAPFRFTGFLLYPYQPFADPNPFPRREDTLVGSGTATIDLVWQGGNAQLGAWTYAGARYEFSPVPEPSTFLLVAPFAVGVAARRKFSSAVR